MLFNWIPHRAEFLSVILESEAPTSPKCLECNANPFQVQCLDCFGTPALCKVCMVKTHKCLPFHKIEIWKGNCFLPTQLMQIGYLLYLGHNGGPCPYIPHHLQIGTLLTIVDSSGVHEHKVVKCFCPKSPEFYIQLLKQQLYPATISQPETAFTFSVLDNFYLDEMECKTSASNFFNKIRRITNNSFPHLVPVCK